VKATTEFWRDIAIPYAESRRACHSRACYKPHSHVTFSIGAVDQGVSHFMGAGTKPVALHAGTVVLIPASRVHACNPATDTAWSYQMLHLDADWLRVVRLEDSFAGAACDDNEPVRIVTEPDIYVAFCRLNSLLFSGTDFREKEAALIEFVGDCDATQGRRIDFPLVSRKLADRLRPVFDFLSAEPTAETALSNLAELARMSRYQLIRAFRKTTGMTPHAWQLNQRINLARQWIRRGESITDVAHRLGFADQAHFQRVFKAYAGVTPGCFRN
jgi:AraC-like DNA-binding protein